MKKLLLLLLVITVNTLCMDNTPENLMFCMDGVPLSELPTEDYLRLLTNTHNIFVDYYNHCSQQIREYKLHNDHIHFVNQALYERHIFNVLYLALERYNPELNQTVTKQKERFDFSSSPLPENFEQLQALDQLMNDYEKRKISMRKLIKFYCKNSNNDNTRYIKYYIASRLFFDRFPNNVLPKINFNGYQNIAYTDYHEELFTRNTSKHLYELLEEKLNNTNDDITAPYFKALLYNIAHDVRRDIFDHIEANNLEKERRKS